MTREALSSLAPWIAFRPTPPHPNTATVAPALMPGALMTPPTPVVTQQPIECRHVDRHVGWDRIARLRGHDRLLGEDADLGHLPDFVSFAVAEAKRAIHLPGSGISERVAQIREAVATTSAIAAVGDEGEDAAVAGRQSPHAVADGLHRPRPFVTECHGKRQRAGAVDDVVVAGADASSAHLDQDFVSLRRCVVDFDDLERLADFVEDGSFHGVGQASADLMARPASSAASLPSSITGFAKKPWICPS